MLNRKSFLRSCGILVILLMSFSISSAQDIWSVGDGDWNNPNTWNLNRQPQWGEWVLINVEDSVRLDRFGNWGAGGFFRIDVDGTLYPEVQPDAALCVVLQAQDRIQVNAGGRILGYDLANVRPANITGVSGPIALWANTVNNFGEIEGGNNFQDDWGNARWSSGPSAILIGSAQTMNFTNQGTITSGSGIMGENLTTIGGPIFICAENNVQNNAGGIIHAGDGYVSEPPPVPFSLGGGGIVVIWDDEEPDFGVFNINGDGGQIIGGCDDGPTTFCENFTNFLHVVGDDDPGANISFSGPGTRIDQFGFVHFLSLNLQPATSISLTMLDALSVQARRNYCGAVTSGPANGGMIWIKYSLESFVDMQGNPNGTNVLVSENEDPVGEPASIHFEHVAEPANVLLDDGVDLTAICSPDPIFWGVRQIETFSVGYLCPGLPDIYATSEPYLVPGLGFPGDTAEIWMRFINVGERHDFRIQISEELGYNYSPHTVWVNSSYAPDTTFRIWFKIPYSDTVGTTNNIWIKSATYPEGELADSINWKVVVVPPVKVYPEDDFCGQPGSTDTLSVIIRNHSEFGENFDVYRTSESWYVYPGYQSIWIPSHSEDTVKFFIDIPPGAQSGDTNWVAFEASISGGRDDFWDSDTTMVTAILPPAPSGLVIIESHPDIILAWDPVPGTPNYEIYTASTPDGPWSPLDTTSDTTYTHSGVINSYEKLFYYVTSSD